MSPALLTTGYAVLLLVAVQIGRPALAVVVALLQLVLAWGWSHLLALPPDRGRSIVILGTGLAADAAVLLLDDDEPSVGPLAGVIGLAVVASVARELFRRDGRPRLTPSLATTTLGAVVAALAAGWLASRAAVAPTTVALVVLSATVLAVMLTATPLPRTLVSMSAAAVGAGLGAAAGVAELDVAVTRLGGAVLGLGAALVAVIAATFVRGTRPPRAAAMSAGAILPLCFAGAAAYVLGRIIVG